ncbi:SufE family protein [Shewanella sp. VB17]|uniref:SufE family protein n=1 Tax=Shewanella sp. VB17 TaxID=2739432 RepID=UPI0015668DB6|nr:SufE family protein [Shewanella sp. VB17]NRD75167.1 SufE family protein [Shewanella sp. VB17]
MSQVSKPSTDTFLALQLNHTEILPLFEQANNWQERYRQIMLLGKSIPKLDNDFKLESAQVKGCESSAWLYHQEIEKKHYFLGDSDARVVKGLIGLLLVACNGKTGTEITAFDIDKYFDKLGLTGQLSPSRTNGLFALAKAMKAVV